MPEIAEVARITHFLRQHLVGRTITRCVATDDANVYGKVSTTASAFQAAVTGKKVVDAGSQGKYFWVLLDTPPHPVMHFGMTGWLHIRGMQTGYTRYVEKNGGGKGVGEEWPPKFSKFHLEASSAAGGGGNKKGATKKQPAEDNDKVEICFTDPRRFGRIRLVQPPAGISPLDIRSCTPLVENGPDPVVDRDGDDGFTLDYLRSRLSRRHVPVKAFLLDQAEISGIGNWVGDEVLYQARIHPEEYSDELDDQETKTLWEKCCAVCDFAVEVLGESDKFPEDWLFEHRWGKGKGGKGSDNKLPSGEKFEWITVGGRTSCFVPSVQKRKGKVGGGAKGKGEKAGKVKKEKDDGEEVGGETESRFFKQEEVEGTEVTKKGKTKAKRAQRPEELAKQQENEEVEDRPSKRVKKTSTAATGKKTRKSGVKKEEDDQDKEKVITKGKNLKPAVEDTTSRRRSGRLSGRGS